MIGNWDGMLGLEKPCYLAKVLFAQYFPSLFFSAESREHDYGKLFPLGRTFNYMLEESGYMHIQSTKPDTIGSALVDSPVGLAAYILEKFSTWTNEEYRNRDDGGLGERFTLDELLTNVMIYWTSGNIAASQRFYKEAAFKDTELARYAWIWLYTLRIIGLTSPSLSLSLFTVPKSPFQRLLLTHLMR